VAIPERLRAALADRYTVERELGQGGMATVYLAHDLRHGRPVALKVLRPELAAVIGAERFLTEIRTTAALQHPHILPLHDSGEADSFLYYVMPFVDGESLRARLVREQQLPVAEAVRVATQVASALDYAHRRGVIHRDIKPENILLHEGQALVADFGIALAVSQAGSSRLTETGLSLGTPHYMSPEQALGERNITPRSDVYALGTVLHELLAGEPPFTGPTAQAVVAKLLADPPTPLRRHRPAVPEVVEAAVLTALEKLPADRFASAAELAEALRAERPVVRAGGAPARRAAPRRLLWPAALMVVGLVGAAGWLRPAGPDAGGERTVRFPVSLPAGFLISPNYPAPTFSPDGRRLVLPGARSSQRQLFLLTLSEGEPRPIPGTENARGSAFSPDGRWLAVIAEGDLKKIALDGGSPVTLTDAEGLGVAWGDDGTIVYNRKYNSGLWRISEGGGTPDSLTAPAQGELGHWWPDFLPGGDAVLFTAYGGSIDQARIDAVSLKTRTRKALVEGAAYSRLDPGGRLLFLRARNIMAVPFRARSLEVAGAPEPVLQHVAVDRLTAQPVFALSRVGDMAWVADSLFLAPRDLVWLDRKGRETRAGPEAALYALPRVSPDGRRLAVTIEEEHPDVWVLDLASGIRTRLTRSPGIEDSPVWSHDGKRVYYQSETAAYDLYSRAADASDSARLLLSTRFDKYPYSITPDGRRLAMMEERVRQRILVVPLDPAGPPVAVAGGDYDLETPMISPDGRWLAFGSWESGRLQLVVAPLDPGAGPRRQLTQSAIAAGDEHAWIRWSPGVDELLYASGDSLMAVSFDAGTGAGGTPRTLLRGPYVFADVAPDGRILALKTPDDAAARRFDVVLGWPALRGRR
jgi:serine/threonine-protein kinase